MEKQLRLLRDRENASKVVGFMLDNGMNDNESLMALALALASFLSFWDKYTIQEECNLLAELAISLKEDYKNKNKNK